MLHTKINSKYIKVPNSLRIQTIDSNEPWKWKWLLTWSQDEENFLSIKVMEEIVKEKITDLNIWKLKSSAHQNHKNKRKTKNWKNNCSKMETGKCSHCIRKNGQVTSIEFTEEGKGVNKHVKMFNITSNWWNTTKSEILFSPTGSAKI